MGLFKPGAEAIRAKFARSLLEMPRSMPKDAAISRAEDATCHDTIETMRQRREATGASIGVAGAVLTMGWLSVTAVGQDAMVATANKLAAISPGLVSIDQVQETFARLHPVLNAANALLNQGNTTGALLATGAAMMATGIGLMATRHPGAHAEDAVRRDVRRVVNGTTAQHRPEPGFDPAPGV